MVQARKSMLSMAAPLRVLLSLATLPVLVEIFPTVTACVVEGGVVDARSCRIDVLTSDS